MTTIAFDGKTLAVDSMANNDSFVTSRTVRKMWGATGRFDCVVMAGPTSHYPPVLKWLEDGADPTTWKDWDAVAWVVNENGEVLRYISGYPETVKDIDADGSGAEIAMGALAAGATAREAVQIAIDYDLHSGGTVSAHDIEKKLTTHRWASESR